MSEPKKLTAEEHLAAVKKARPKPGTYPTFTSRRNESVIPFQKVRYTYPEKGRSRELADEHVKVVVQKGIEFDAWAACLGSVDGKTAPSPQLYKWVTEGYIRNGERVLLDPKELHEHILRKTKQPENRVIFWEERERPESEKRLEKAIKERDVKLEAKDGQIANLAALLKGKVGQDQIDKILAGG